MSAGPMGPGPGDPAETAVAGAPQGAPGPGYDPRFERGPGGPSGPAAYPGYPPAGPGYAQPNDGGHHPGHDRAAEAAAFARRHIRTPETKEFFKTSEFFVWLVVAVFTLIAAAISDEFGPRSAWLYVTILSAAYMVSRGIAKSAARRGDPERDWDRR